MNINGPLTEEQYRRFIRCYQAYIKQGGKGQSERTWKKHNPSEEQTEEIYQAIIAQKKYMQESNEDLKYVRSFSKWMNDYGWRDEIGSHSELRRQKSLGDIGKCSSCLVRDCIGPKYNLCSVCYPDKWEEDRNKFFEKNGLSGKTKEELRKTARELFKSMSRRYRT